MGECARIWQVQSMRQAPRFVIARRPQADVAISGRHCPSERAIVKTATAPDLSLRGGHRPTWQSREGTSSSYKVPIKTYQPIASVAALTAQPLAALPPYGCGVPLAGSDRLVQSHSTAGGHWCTAALPDVSLRGAKRRGALSAKREEVPLGCNLGKALPVRARCR